MKELRKRVNGLIAILLAVCMSLEMSGVRVSAAVIAVGASDTSITDCVNKTFSEVGDGLEKKSSGGNFFINAASDIGEYLSPAKGGTGIYIPGDTKDYYEKVTISKELPVEYKALQITSVDETNYRDTDSHLIYEITFAWVPAQVYTLNFDLNGGTTGALSQKYQWNKTYVFPESDKFIRAGYELMGWSFSPDATEATYEPGTEFSFPDNNEVTTVIDGQELTLYAVWDPYAYTAMFNPGSVGQENPTGVEMGIMESTSNQPIILPECTYALPNYHFAGWKYMGDVESVPDSLEENIGTIYPAGSTFEYLPDYDGASLQFEAQWEPNTVSVSYDANGGTGTMVGATYTYDGSIFAYLLPGADGSLSKDGYRFIGWCENADGSSDIMPEGYQYPLDFSKGNQDITLYAIWEPNAYSIRFNGNGGTGEMANQAGISSEPTILNPNQFTSIDQMFAGWSTTGTGTVQYADRASFDYKASTNNQVVDLFAIWTKLYKLAFDANGGGGTMDTLLNGIDGIGQTLPECAFTKEGFVFKGWATNPYTLTAEYQPGDAFTYSPQTAGETVTLYAIWEAEGANAADRIQVGLGTVYLTAGQEYFFGEDGVYKVDGDPNAYPMNTIFYVPVSGNYTISVQ